MVPIRSFAMTVGEKAKLFREAVEPAIKEALGVQLVAELVSRSELYLRRFRQIPEDERRAIANQGAKRVVDFIDRGRAIPSREAGLTDRVCKHLAIDWLRKHRHQSAEESLDGHLDRPADGPSYDRQIDIRRCADAIVDVLADDSPRGLTRTQRELLKRIAAGSDTRALIQSELKHEAPEDVTSTAFIRDRDAVYQRVRRARSALRKQLELRFGAGSVEQWLGPKGRGE